MAVATAAKVAGGGAVAGAGTKIFVEVKSVTLSEPLEPSATLGGQGPGQPGQAATGGDAGPPRIALFPDTVGQVI